MATLGDLQRALFPTARLHGAPGGDSIGGPATGGPGADGAATPGRDGADRDVG